jgi:hypothetical protein
VLCHLRAIKSVFIFHCAQDVFKAGFFPIHRSIHLPNEPWGHPMYLSQPVIMVPVWDLGGYILNKTCFQQIPSTSIWKIERFTKYLTCQLNKTKFLDTGSPLIWCNFTSLDFLVLFHKKEMFSKHKNGFPCQLIWR